MAGTVMPTPIQQFLDNNGDPAAGFKLYTYAADSTTNQATYSDAALSVANANPIVLDANGRATVFLADLTYKFVLKNAAADATIWSQDDISSVPTGSDNLEITGTAGEALAANNLVYLSDGRGSKTAGKWYKTDSDADYANTDALLGIATETIAADATGKIRVAGTMTGFSGMTQGKDQYLSGTAGGLTNTKPTNWRTVGRAISSSELMITFSPARTDLALSQVCEGRLSLESGVPVSTSDQTAKTSVYFMPYHGNRVSLYDTSTGRWTIHEFAQLTFSLTDLTADRNYDLYVYSLNGVVTVDNNGLTTWGSSNNTSRQTASELESQDGVWVKKDAHNYRYLGTIRTTDTTGQCEDSFAKRLVWNAYNQVDRAMYHLPSADSWSYNLNVIRQAGATASNQVECVTGRDGNAITVDNAVMYSHSAAATNTYVAVGIGESATDTNATGCQMLASNPQVAASTDFVSAHLKKHKSEGYHFYTMTEVVTEVAGQSTTFYGDNGQAARRQSGISAILRN